MKQMTSVLETNDYWNNETSNIILCYINTKCHFWHFG